MGKRKHRQRQKACDRCFERASVLYRVQWDESRRWRFVCPDCWTRVQADNPFYTYGGTWKAQKE